MAAGHTPAELTHEGYTVWDAASSTLGAPASSRAGGLVSLPFYDHGAPVNLERLQKNPAVAAAEYVRAQSTDPSLQSYNYRLEDRPATQRFLIPAEAAMVAGGFVTRAQIDDGSTIFLISDDPINGGHLIVTVDVSGPLVRNRPAPPNSHSLIAVVAFMDRTSGQVLDVGFGSWNIVP